MALETPRYPLDKNQLGNASWKVLHSYAAQYPDNPKREDKQEFHALLKAVVRTIPEGDCKCKSHAVEYIQKKNPTMNNRKELVTWLCEFHNDTNKRSHKELIDCADLLHNTGDCPSCKIKTKEERGTENVKAVTAADSDGPLKTVLGDYKKMSIKVFEELCHREGIPVPKIIFAPCPPPNDHTSCTTFVTNPDRTMMKEGNDGREPTVYINPNNFGLRVLVHEWHEYQRQMKHSGQYLPHDEETVEKNTRDIIHKYFPRDYYDYEKQAIVQPIVMKDEMVAPPAVAVQEEKPKPFSFRNRTNYRNSFTTDEFPMFTKYREKQKLAQAEELEASKSESSGMLSPFDVFYEPFAKLMNLSPRDVNLANTPNIFQQGAKIALDSQLTPFGTLVASSVVALGLFAATILNKDGIGISDRRLLSYLGSNFLWSGLESATSPAIKQTASQVGSHLANMEFDQITKLMVNDNSIFAGLTESQAQQQAGVQARAQQRAAGIGGGGRGVAGRAGSRAGAVAPPPPSVAESVIERVQQRALNPEGNQPESLKMFKNFPSPAAGGAVPRTDSGGGRSFTYVPTPVSPYDMPQDEIDYNAMLGIPTEPTELLPSRNLGMTLTDEELEQLR